MLRVLWNEMLARIRRYLAPQTLGQRGEIAARKLLQRKGYKIVGGGERDFLGELDLVAVDGRTVVFVEVKTRATHDAGHPAEAVDQDKQRRLTRLALSYLRRHGLLENAVRFDVVAITWPTNTKQPTIEHIESAFPAVGRASMFS
ncbi:MAG: YraN family protein [Planctomycetia bacterium]|nr:YraN family protein [Planctomycetia bacterium]